MTGNKAKLSKGDRRERQAKVAELWYKGYTNGDIIVATGIPGKEVSGYLKLIKEHLTPRAVKVLEYRKNKCLNKVSLVQKAAWEIAEGAISVPDQLSALRVVTSSQELEAKIEGVTQEKLIVGPEKAATELLRDLRELEKKVTTDNGKEPGQAAVEETVPPAFLKE